MRNIAFEGIDTVFQNQLNKDINMINKDPFLFIPEDKTNNLYKVSNKDTYSKLLRDNITKSYKRSNVNLINNINIEVNTIRAELKIDDRMKQFNQREAFLTHKDLEVNF